MTPRDAAGGVIVNKEGKVALVWQNGNSWSFPKGGIDPGEDTLEAAWREINEETGLTKDDLAYKGELGAVMRRSIGHNGIGEDMDRPESKRTFYLFTTEKTEMDPQDAEVTKAEFVTVDEALDMLTHPKDKEFLQSVREKLAP
jgi:8-oxo-dGTP pyrophosphatase MutT (NUDIX family)